MRKVVWLEKSFCYEIHHVWQAWFPTTNLTTTTNNNLLQECASLRAVNCKLAKRCGFLPDKKKYHRRKKVPARGPIKLSCK